jgi:hypothetical protein
MILHHYTCQRNARLITAMGRLVPQPQDLHDGDPLLWLTTLPARRRGMVRALGLAHHTSREGCVDQRPICDPIAAKFSVLADDLVDEVVPLHFFLARYPDLRRIYQPLPGALLHTWWVSFVSLPLYRSPIRRPRTEVTR